MLQSATEDPRSGQPQLYQRMERAKGVIGPIPGPISYFLISLRKV